jgi:hypothetical protein
MLIYDFLNLLLNEVGNGIYFLNRLGSRSN